METNLTLGQKIKRYRLMNDIRQEDMAEKLDVSRATLINYEKGHTTINVDVLGRLKNAYPDFDIDNKHQKKPKIINNNTIDFGVLFRLLYKRRKNIIFSTIIFSIIGTGFSFLYTKMYSAEISLYPTKRDVMQGLSQFQSLATNFGMKMPENNQDFNIPDVVKSRLIANKVIDQKWINNNNIVVNLYDLWQMGTHNWYKILSSTNNDSAYLKEKAIKKLSDHIDVVENRLTGLITIYVTLEDPNISASVANFIGDQVQLYIQKENSAQSTKEKLFIADRLFIVKSELETSEKSLKDFKERNHGYENSPELFMVFSRIFREVEAKKQVYLTLQQQLELSRIDEVKQASILHILDHAIPPSRKSSPKRFLFLIFSCLFGLIASSFVIIIKY